MQTRLNTIPENFEIGNRGLPINEIGRRIKVNSKGKPIYNKNGNPVYNGNIFFNSEGNPFYKNSSNQKLISPELYLKSQIYQERVAPEQFLRNQMMVENSNKIRTNNNTGFKYFKQGEKRIKVNSSGQPEKYSNGRNVILGEQGYPINSNGQILSFNVKTGDLLKNASKNPYVYNPDLEGFKIPESEIKYRYPTSLPAKPRNTAKLFFNAQGPGQALEPARFGQKSQSPLGGFKVHKTHPESLFKNNKPAGNNESNNSHLFNTGKRKKSGLLSLFSGLSFSGKKK